MYNISKIYLLECFPSITNQPSVFLLSLYCGVHWKPLIDMFCRWYAQEVWIAVDVPPGHIRCQVRALTRLARTWRISRDVWCSNDKTFQVSCKVICFSETANSQPTSISGTCSVLLTALTYETYCTPTLIRHTTLHRILINVLVQGPVRVYRV